MGKHKKYEELTFTDDFMFCKVLENNEELCRDLVEVILNTKIRIIKQVGKQKAIEITPDAKGIRLDVYMEGDDRIFNLEMQNVKKKELPRRSRYYQAVMDLDNLNRGTRYDELQDSYIIFICNKFDPFDRGYSTYTVKSVIEEDPEIQYNDGTHKLFLSSLPDLKGTLSPDLRQFLNFLNTNVPEGELANRLAAAVEHAKSMDPWRKEYMFLYELKDEGRIEGIQENKEQMRELYRAMKSDGRIDEYDAAMESSDPTLLDSLLTEYNLTEPETAPEFEMQE